MNDLTSRIKQTDKQHSKDLPPSVEQLAAACHIDSGIVSGEVTERKSEVSRELMEKERDLREALREAAEERERSQKLKEDKEQFEKKLVKRGVEMEVKYRELDMTVTDLTRMLGERGEVYTQTERDKQIERESTWRYRDRQRDRHTKTRT